MITAASLFAGVCRAPAASLPLAITDRTLPSVDGWGYYTSGVAVQVSLGRCRRGFVRFWKSQELCLKDQITQIAKTYLSFTPSGINCAVLVLMWQSLEISETPKCKEATWSFVCAAQRIECLFWTNSTGACLSKNNVFYVRYSTDFTVHTNVSLEKSSYIFLLLLSMISNP